MIPNTGILASTILPCIVSHIFTGEHKGWFVWLVQSWALRRGLNTDAGMWAEFRTIAAPGQISLPLSSLPPQLSSFFTRLHPQTLAASVSSCSSLQAQMTVSWHQNGATGEEAACMLVINPGTRLPLKPHWATAFLIVHHAKPFSWLQTSLLLQLLTFPFWRSWF